jgi:hypothetical protein
MENSKLVPFLIMKIDGFLFRFLLGILV